MVTLNVCSKGEDLCLWVGCLGGMTKLLLLGGGGTITISFNSFGRGCLGGGCRGGVDLSTSESELGGVERLLADFVDGAVDVVVDLDFDWGIQ